MSSGKADYTKKNDLKYGKIAIKNVRTRQEITKIHYLRKIWKTDFPLAFLFRKFFRFFQFFEFFHQFSLLLTIFREVFGFFSRIFILLVFFNFLILESFYYFKYSLFFSYSQGVSRHLLIIFACFCC